jgi:hypothetical protein
MLALVGLLCLVMVAIQLAARPSSWYWLLPPGETQTASPAEDFSRQVPLEELDFRVREEPREPLPPDVFRAVADENSPPAETEAPAVGQAAGSEQEARAPGEEDGTAVDAFAGEDVSIPPVALADIEDNTIGVRRAEVDAYHQMLATIRRLPDEVRQQHVDTDVAFTVIMLRANRPRSLRTFAGAGLCTGMTGGLRVRWSQPPPSNGCTPHGLETRAT